MYMPMMEQACTRVRFEGFGLIQHTAAGSKSDAQLRPIASIDGTKDISRCRRHPDEPMGTCICNDPSLLVPFANLKEFLLSRGITEKTTKAACTTNVKPP